MRRLAVLLLLPVLFALPLVSPGYLGAEDIGVSVGVIYGDSAILSVTYTPYSTDMSGALTPIGFCCLNFNFYVNGSGAYLLGESWEKPTVYWYRDFYYVFFPSVDGSVEVYRLGENCFEKVLEVKLNTTETNFAVAIPYLVVQTSKDELVAFNVAKNVSVGRFDLTEAEGKAYFKGVTVVREDGEVKLIGDEPERPPSPMGVEIRGNSVGVPGADVAILPDDLSNYLWTQEETEYLRAYRLGNGVLLVPPEITHYFAPDGNSTGELLVFDNESVPVRGVSDLYVLYHDGKLRAFRLGEPTGTNFLSVGDAPSFTPCPTTHPVTVWLGMGLLLLLGLVWWLATRK